MQICIFCSVIKTPFLWTYQQFSRAQTHRNHPTMVPPKVYPEPLWTHQKLKYQSHGTHVKATVARKWMNGCYSLGYHFSLQVPFGTAVPNNEPTNIEICYVLTGPNWWYHIWLDQLVGCKILKILIYTRDSQTCIRLEGPKQKRLHNRTLCITNFSLYICRIIPW